MRHGLRLVVPIPQAFVLEGMLERALLSQTRSTDHSGKAHVSERRIVVINRVYVPIRLEEVLEPEL